MAKPNLKRTQRELEAVLGEGLRRREMLVAAYLVETGLPLRRIEVVQRASPLLSAWWVDERATRRSLREWWRDVLWRLRDPFRRRLRGLASEFKALGLDPRHTAVFEEQHGAAVKVYFAERKQLQVVCRVCKKQVALVDWEKHVAKVHGSQP